MIRILSRPSLDREALADFLESEGEYWNKTQNASDSEDLIELAGRICYFSYGEAQSPKSNKEFIANLISKGHESVLEHATWTFLVSGVSRAFTHQLVRHRVGFSFSQISQQYHDESIADCILHPRVQEEAVAQIVEGAYEDAQQAYKKIIKKLESKYESELTSANSQTKREIRRFIRSTARSVLPNSTEVKLVVSANGRSLRHFLKLRGAVLGDFEMRQFSYDLLILLQQEAPSLFLDFTAIEAGIDGHPLVSYEPI